MPGKGVAFADSVGYLVAAAQPPEARACHPALECARGVSAYTVLEVEARVAGCIAWLLVGLECKHMEGGLGLS